jgi:3-oxoacyl-[acyl-carrier protein] reductase
MQLNLAGKNVLVTGSTRGIGLSIARRFSKEGCNVVLNGRTVVSPDAVETIKNGQYVIGDVSSEDGAKKVIDETIEILGSLDVVVCNVGSGISVAPGNENLKEWQKSFAINFFSTTCVVEQAKIHLQKSAGIIICISSICGIEVIPGAPVTYSVAKAALNAYISGMARPLGDMGVRICGIAPGNILFDGSVWDNKIKQDPNAVSKMLETNVALKEFGLPEKISSLATFLASEESSFTTGNVTVVDGGQVRSH